MLSAPIKASNRIECLSENVSIGFQTGILDIRKRLVIAINLPPPKPEG